MSHEDATIRALRRVIDEARTAPPPSLDWDAVEERVLARLGDTPAPRRSSFKRIVVAATAVAVAAAAAAVLIPRHHASAPVAVLAPVHHVLGPGIAALDGSSLAVGDTVIAGAHAIVVTEPGRAVWTLSPHSSATMADAGRYMTVRLEEGTVAVAVVPRHVPESFAVEVGRTRVAAHGTRFTVELAGDRAKVVLDEGVIVVGAAGSPGQTQGFTMRAPSTGSFSLDGARVGEVHGPVTEQAPATPERVARVTPQAHVAPLPDQPSSADLDHGTASVMALVEKCFADHTDTARGVTISVRSTLSFDVTPEGKATNLRSDPPLAPDVQQCSEQAASAALFARSKRGAAVTGTLHLAN